MRCRWGTTVRTDGWAVKIPLCIITMLRLIQVASFPSFFLSQYDLPSQAPICTLDLSLDKNSCTLVQTKGRVIT